MSSYTHNTKVYGWKDKKFVFFSKQTSISPGISTLSVSFGRCGSRTFSHTQIHTHTYTYIYVQSQSRLVLVRALAHAHLQQSSGGVDGMGWDARCISVSVTRHSLRQEARGRRCPRIPRCMRAPVSRLVSRESTLALFPGHRPPPPLAGKHTYNPIQPYSCTIFDFK